MGCFLACFGYTKKRKRLKPANRALPGNKRFGSYEPLDSISIETDIKEEDPVASNSDSSLLVREKPKQKSSLRIRKKVSFNLNVQTYEPINVEEFSESDEENKGGNKQEERADAGASKDSISSKVGSYPQNYRYINFLDSCDQEDGIVSDDYDMDDDEDYDEEYEDDDDDCGYYHSDNQNLSQEGFTSDEAFLSELVEENTNTMHPSDSLDRTRSIELNQNARDRSQYVHSVLYPVENLTQWKAAKARANPSTRHQSKENVALPKEPLISFSSKLDQSKPLLQEISVNASLSNWMDFNSPSVANKP